MFNNLHGGAKFPNEEGDTELSIKNLIFWKKSHKWLRKGQNR